ncbi:2637_t:CDS:2, partial [Funneliformis geosporum]
EISQINDNSILIPCAIIDHIDGNIKKCSSTNKLRRLWQLVGTWELDTDTVIQAKIQLENLGITKIANSNDINLKNKALSLIAPTLQILEKHETIDSITIPSFFTIQTIFKFYQINLNNEEADWSSEKCYNFDKQIANLLLKNRKQIESQKLHLEEPKSSLEFYEALPFQLIQFFENMIQTLLERLYNQTNERQQQRQKNYNSKNLNAKKVQKT